MEDQSGAAFLATDPQLPDTDMAYERHRAAKGVRDTFYHEAQLGEIGVSALLVTGKKGARALGRPCGRYLSLFFPSPLFWHPALRSQLRDILLCALRFYFSPMPKTVLVAGLGNRRLTPDAFGPLAAERVDATAALPNAPIRNTSEENFSRVAVHIPDVFAQTGIESTDSIGAAVSLCHAEGVLVLDALATREKERMLSVIELSDTGTVAGGGVKNHRKTISEETLGVPTVSLGVPTVVREGDGFFLVPRGLEDGTDAICALVADAINLAFDRGYPSPFPPKKIQDLFTP